MLKVVVACGVISAGFAATASQAQGGSVDDKSAAIQRLVAELAANPNSIPANNALGKLLLAAHRNPEAMDRFETVLAVAPHDAEARRDEFDAVTELAAAAAAKGHPEVAVQALQHARMRLPDDPRLLIDLGVEETDTHEYAKAVATLDEALLLSPGDPDALYARAQAELGWQHLAAAEADLRAYLHATPEDASAHFGLGHVLAMELHNEEAQAEFARSVALQPKQTESYYQLGELALKAGEEKTAESNFRKVLARDPKHPGALTGVGELAFRRKDYAAAEPLLRTAEEAAPSYGPAFYFRGLTLLRLGRTAEGNADLATAAKLGHEPEQPVER